MRRSWQPGEDWRQAPILRVDIHDAGTRRIIATPRHAIRDHIEPKLAGIHIPTLLVRGARDRIAPQPWLDRAAELTPAARTLVLGIHHVRGGPNQLWWDLAFLVAGVVLAVAGWMLQRHATPAQPPVPSDDTASR
jgi:hypothetical protein